MMQQNFEHFFNEHAFQTVFEVSLQRQIEQNQRPQANAFSVEAVNTPFKIEFESGYYYEQIIQNHNALHHRQEHKSNTMIILLGWKFVRKFWDQKICGSLIIKN